MGDTGLTLQEFRTVLRLDLKDSGALWSDAELDRSVYRAVEDMSRSIPLEQVYEHTLDFDVTDEEVTTPAAASATAIIGATTLVGVTSLDRFTIADTTPEVPRRLTVTLKDTTPTVTVFNFIIRGTDQNGNYIEEKWFRKDLVTTVAKQGELYFKTVVEVEVHALGGGSMTGNTVSVGVGNPYDSYVFMANKPIKPESEKVYSAASSGTLFVRDTDYTIDYVNGAIKFINGSGMALGTKYYVNYTKSELGIDLSAILPVMTRVTKVEYPVDKVPQQFPAFSIWGKFMCIGSQKPGESQTTLIDGEHLAIYYEREQMAPSQHSPGSYPAFLDQVITIGAGAYALLIEALQYEQQAVTDLGEVRTTLGYLGTSTTLIYKAIDDALDNVALYLETNEITTNADNANARAILEEITTQAANLRTAANGAIAGSDTVLGTISITTLTANITAVGVALDKVSQYLQTHDVDVGGVDNAEAILENITDDIANLRSAVDGARAGADAVLGKVSSVDLDDATDGAVKMLQTGHPLINTLTDGKDVSENYADYARAGAQSGITRIQTALAYIQEANLALSNLRSHIEEAGAWMRMGETFIAEASQRNAAAIGVANGERIKTEQAAGYISEANSRLAVLRSYIEDATSWMRMGEIFIGEAQARMGEADRYLAEAAQYQTTAEVDMVLSDRFRAEGQLRLAEFHTILASKAEYRKRVVSVPVRQPA